MSKGSAQCLVAFSGQFDRNGNFVGVDPSIGYSMMAYSSNKSITEISSKQMGVTENNNAEVGNNAQKDGLLIEKDIQISDFGVAA